MLWLDRLAAGLLAPLGMWVLASGLDDLFLDLCSLYFRLADWWRRGRRSARARQSDPIPEKRIALLIPAWREDGVIERMLEHNLAAIRYSNYEIFVGVYPNDLRTRSRVAACEARHERVHCVVCPHDGPTSKADCLNWVYQGMLACEDALGRRFDLVLHHDAEDLIHPQALEWINRYSEEYDMVQVPVLPLPTPWWELTHGAYCGEFAQSHLRDLHVRQRLGGFLPSCGVGTAYRRRALDRVAWNNGNRVFHPESLTEDYHIGLELHRLGCSQILLDARRLGGERGPAATREYFPRGFRSAVRQRARWVAGIALQSWQQEGWNGGPGQTYWLWRDRKALVGNAMTMLANLIFLYGAGRWVWAEATATPWHFGEVLTGSWWLWWMLVINTSFIVLRQTSRALCVGPVYGWWQAVLTPVRSVWGNLINFVATVRAVGLFLGAQVRREPLQWMKTDHCYPSGQTLRAHKRRLGEVLVEMRLLGAPQVEESAASLRPGERLGERLVRAGVLSEDDLYRALSRQQSVPFATVEEEALAVEALHRLPGRLARELAVIPLRVSDDRYLWVAGPELPSDAVGQRISELTALEARFQLITPSNYRRLCARLQAGSKGQEDPAVFPPSTKMTWPVM